MAETINNWETSSEYKDSFTVLIQDLDDVRFFADALIKEAGSKTTVNPLRPLIVHFQVQDIHSSVARVSKTAN